MNHELSSNAGIIAISEANLYSPREVKNAGLIMESLFLGTKSPSFEDIETAIGKDAISRLRLLYEKYETNLEYEFAQKIITGQAMVEQYPMYQRFKRLVQGEIDLANISSRDRALFVGSGPFPISAIILTRQTGAHVDCLDMSGQACEISEQVIEHLGLKNRIKIINDAGHTRKLYGYSVMFVALLAQPKVDILEKAQFSVPHGTRVICRTSEGITQVFYKPADPYSFRCLGRYRLDGKHEAGIEDTVTSLLLRIEGPRENR